MTELDKERKNPKKYLWFGYGNYGTQPNVQMPVGNVRDPGLLAEFSKETKTNSSPMTFFGCVAMAVIGLMAFVMVLAWGMSLLLK